MSQKFGFEEAPAKFQAKPKAATKPAHGGAGMQAILMDVCSELEGYEAYANTPEAQNSGSIRSTFGRIHAANSGLPLPKEDYRDALRTLAEKMKDDGGGDGPAKAGHTFFGQFIDHDLTLDVTTMLGKFAGDPSRIDNFRTPRLDLDCVYGGGPEVSPHMYDRTRAGRLLFGRETGEGHRATNPWDLPRNSQGTALIGDPRNDENLFVSQTHGRKFVAEHNVLIDSGMDFEEAREQMIERYHHDIIHDFLPAIVDETVLAPYLNWLGGGAEPDDGHLHWNKVPDMPVEFSAAAYRFGHSMVRQRYSLNAEMQRVAIFNGPLRGFSPVEVENNLDLDLFFGAGAQSSRPIDTKIPTALIELPASVVGTGERNLAFRNMDRGQVTFRLPTGEMMANYMDKSVIAPHAFVQGTALEGETPLWFYILAEAEDHGGKLGPVGGGLVAGVLVNLLRKSASPMAAHLVG